MKKFTLVELLVVITIIAILASMLLPSLARAKDEARRVQCLSNLHQMQLGYLSYVDDNDEVFPSSNTGNYPCWVKSGDSIDAIEGGTLFEYYRDWKIYHCPKDRVNDYRSYSINSRFNGEKDPKKRLSHVRRATSEVFIFIEESDPRGWNMNSFFVNPNGVSTWQTADWVGVFHDYRYNTSFLDGHCETIRVFEPVSAHASGVKGIWIPSSNEDLKRIVEMSAFD